MGIIARTQTTMPKVRTSRKRPPPGFEVLQDTLDNLDRQMRDAEAEPADAKPKNELHWAIFRIHHQRSRYVYEMFYKKKKISREVYEYCLREKYADAQLIAKWKKPGYDRLCCLRCMQTSNHNFGSTCICRVPRKDLEEGTTQCVNCG